MGALSGLSYVAVSQMVNRIALPGVPIYQPPLGPAGNILAGVLLGAALGLLVMLPESAALGILLGSVAGAAGVVGAGLLSMTSFLNTSLAVITGIVLSVPLAWLVVPAVAVLRWLAEKQVEAATSSAPLLGRYLPPVALAVLLAFLASFDLMPPVARGELRRMNEMVDAGLRATNSAALPDPLRASSVQAFPAGSPQRYSLEWTQQDLDRFIDLRPASSYDQHAAVIARFAGGYTLVCLYPTPSREPICGEY